VHAHAITHLNFFNYFNNLEEKFNEMHNVLAKFAVPPH
jgi:hypothetical protein